MSDANQTLRTNLNFGKKHNQLNPTTSVPYSALLQTFHITYRRLILIELSTCFPCRDAAPSISTTPAINEFGASLSPYTRYIIPFILHNEENDIHQPQFLADGIKLSFSGQQEADSFYSISYMEILGRYVSWTGHYFGLNWCLCLLLEIRSQRCINVMPIHFGRFHFINK